jgi:hypothetical protein
MANKYDIHWQVARINAKNASSLDEKMHSVFGYLDAVKTEDAYDRVLNWLMGIERGYRKHSRENVDRLVQAQEQLKLKKNEYKGTQEVSLDFSSYSNDVLKSLFNDLKTRSIKWLQKGYWHRDQESFLDALIEELGRRKVSINTTTLYAHREESKVKENTHKFFF